MIRRVIVAGCLVFLWGVWAVAAEAGALYLCDDGGTVLLTDVEALGCPRYVPAADITVVRDGATWSEVEWAAATALRNASRRDRAAGERSPPGGSANNGWT